MTRAEIVQECIDRGYDYVQTTRIGTFVDRSLRTIGSKRDWPFLEDDFSGTAPLTISDLRKILSVEDVTNSQELRGADRRWLVANFPGFADSGTPSFWYLEDNTLKLYPVDEAVEVAGRYIKRHPKLADGEEPLIPEEWQYLAVDLAVSHCLKDDDEREEAQALKNDVDVAIETEMAPALLGRDHQGPGFIARTGRAGDYL